ncbi:hypothetical protein [uncultured Akkermansia sp.]|uniref:hypothetical protein n=1 Tax=uncultured Akkermansia sp. TaxID=512294 RepID=UPI0026DC84E7|nr:hypothetical protein [uncultured Akkermansia sp.]
MTAKSLLISRTSICSALLGVILSSCGGSSNGNSQTGETLVGKVYNVVIQTGNLPPAAVTALAETGVGGFVMTPVSVMSASLQSDTGNISTGGYTSYYFQRTSTDTASLKIYYTIRKRTNLAGANAGGQISYNMQLNFPELKYTNKGTHAEGDCIINIAQAQAELGDENPFANNAAVAPATITITDSISVN